MRKVLTLISAFLLPAMVWAQSVEQSEAQTTPANQSLELQSIQPDSSAVDRTMVEGSGSIAQLYHTATLTSQTDTLAKSRFLPTRRRIDRRVEKNSFVYKGEVIMGLTVSYGTLSSEDTDFLLVLENIDADGHIVSVKPYISYAYRNNQSIGVRFGYNNMKGEIGNLGFNLGEQNDLSGSLQDMGFVSENFSFGLFHRSYVGLDPKGRFGLFAELEATVQTGTSDFHYMSGDEVKTTNSKNFKAKLSFNPGVAVYVFPNVCATLSFGLGGIKYSKVTQRDELGNKVGSREASNMSFRLNLADINLGFTLHLWDKKKK